MTVALDADPRDLWPGGPEGMIAVRTRNALLRAGFKTIGEVAASAPDDLLGPGGIRHFGPVQLAEVRRALAAAGFSLKGEAAS